MSTARDIVLYPVRIHQEAPVVGDTPSAIGQAIEGILKGERSKGLKPGARIAVTAGSRGLANYALILKTIIQTLKDKGFDPFLFSAMGSHGRGEPEGQREVLDSLGITQETMNCTVSCSSEVVLIDQAELNGKSIQVYCAKEALEADGVVVVNRIKPHTSFRGDYESGLLKMMTVGMGRAKGALEFHSLGAAGLADAIPLIGGRILEKAPVIGAIGLVENANEQTAVIEGIPKEAIFEQEKELLNQAKAFMPKLPVEQADLCVVGEMGKNYSGTGMDTNIIGRLRIQGVKEPSSPNLSYLGVLRLSEPSHGNATGIGLADFTTDKLVQEIDRKATYLNCLTSGFVVRAAIPMSFPTDLELVEGALKALKFKDGNEMRMIAVRNTLHIDHVWVTKPIYDELKESGKGELVSEPSPIAFDEEGNWKW